AEHALFLRGADEGLGQGIDRILDLDVLGGEEIPRLVLLDRTAQRDERIEVVELQLPETELSQAAMQLRIVDARAVAVQGLAAPEHAEPSRELVAAGLRDDVDEPALRPSVVRRRSRGLDLDL